MILAKDIAKNGMVAGTAFMDEITKTIRERDCKKIIETGSYLGTGTTKAIAAGMDKQSLVFSIEVNPEYFRQAKRNNRESGIHFLHGLSVDKKQIPKNPVFDFPHHVIVDHEEQNRVANYTKEVNFHCKDNLLEVALRQMDYKPDLVVLDSAGHMGWIEYRYLMDRVQGNFILALDDIGHVKHYRTMEHIRDNYETFKILFETPEKFGSAIIEVSVF